METKIYNIDSKDRNSTLNTNSHDFSFTHTSSGNLEPFSEKNVVEMKITSIEIPNSFYFINATKGNNTFTYSGTKTLTSGSYTKTELIAHLNTIASSAIFSYDSTTDKVTFTYSGTGLTFAETSTDYDSIGTILGSKSLYTGKNELKEWSIYAGNPLRYFRERSKNSLELSKKVISLPFHPYIEKKEINKILNLLDKFFLLNFNKL